MKKMLLKALIIYLQIGSFFSTILAISWSWSFFATIIEEHEIVFSLAGFIAFAFSIGVNLILAPLLRIFLWLPSMLSLLSPDVPVTFMQWLAPGFFDHLISSANF